MAARGWTEARRRERARRRVASRYPRATTPRRADAPTPGAARWQSAKDDVGESRMPPPRSQDRNRQSGWFSFGPPTNRRSGPPPAPLARRPGRTRGRAPRRASRSRCPTTTPRTPSQAARPASRSTRRCACPPRVAPRPRCPSRPAAAAFRADSPARVVPAPRLPPRPASRRPPPVASPSRLTSAIPRPPRAPPPQTPPRRRSGLGRGRVPGRRRRETRSWWPPTLADGAGRQRFARRPAADGTWS